MSTAAAAAAALANRSLRTIRTVRVTPTPPLPSPPRPAPPAANPPQELEFLADTAVISAGSLAHILSLLPAEQSPQSLSLSLSSSAPTPTPTPAAGPVPKSTTPAVPHPAQQRFLPIAQQPPPPPPPSAAPPSYSPAPVLSLAEALWAFPGTEPGDLSFQAGDKLEVLEKVKDDWWKGRIAGREHAGLFPSSYVRETQILREKPALPSLPPRAGYGPGGNPMTDVAHGTSVFESQQQEEAAKKPLLGKNGEKFGKKLGNAAIFGAVSRV